MKAIHLKQIFFLVHILTLITLSQGKTNYGNNQDGYGLGEQHALIIAIDDYRYVPKIKLYNPCRDARTLKEVLIKKYGYKEENITELYNEQATEEGIEKEIDKHLEIKGSLLIYFTGHGYFEKKLKNVYWIAYDIGKDLIDNEEIDQLTENEIFKRSDKKINDREIIIQFLRNCQAKHIFIISDSCYSGKTFAEGRRASGDFAKESRQALYSGAATVSDGPSGRNSPFAECLIEELEKNINERLTATDLINKVKKKFKNKSDRKYKQSPNGGYIKDVGDAGGEFVFSRKLSLIERQFKRDYIKFTNRITKKDKLDFGRDLIKKYDNKPEILIREAYAEINKEVEFIEFENSIKRELEILRKTINNLGVDLEDRTNSFLEFEKKYKSEIRKERLKESFPEIFEAISIIDEFRGVKKFIQNKSEKLRKRRKCYRQFKRKTRTLTNAYLPISWVNGMNRHLKKTFKKIKEEEKGRFTMLLTLLKMGPYLTNEADLWYGVELGYLFGKKLNLSPYISVDFPYLEKRFQDCDPLHVETNRLRKYNLGFKVGVTDSLGLMSANLFLEYGFLSFSAKNFRDAGGVYSNFNKISNKDFLTGYSIGFELDAYSINLKFMIPFYKKEKMTYEVTISENYKTYVDVYIEALLGTGMSIGYKFSF